jgi:predicted RNase H-like nuclease (RuvC/YqgF family)
MKPADKTNVFTICDELNEKGIKPTLARVREALGGGSFTTIQPLLKEWKDKRSEVSPTVETVVPNHMIDLVTTMASRIWKEAESKAAEELKAYKDAMQAKLDESNLEKEDALEEVTRLEAMNNQLSDKNKELESKLADYQNALQQARIELKIQSEKLVEAESLMKRHENLLLEVGELRGRIAELTKKK